MVCIKEILEGGRDYVFPRPAHCLKEWCGSNRVWGHGYAGVWFYGYESPVYLKRYRCADCGCVYTIRPAECWPRHRTPIIIIIRRISHRICKGVWDTSMGLTRQAQGNWLRALKKNIKLYIIKRDSGITQIDAGNNPGKYIRLASAGLHPSEYRILYITATSGTIAELCKSRKRSGLLSRCRDERLFKGCAYKNNTLMSSGDGSEKAKTGAHY